MGTHGLQNINNEKENLLSYFGNDIGKCEDLIKVYYYLTHKGFEAYIAEYYRAICGFDTMVNGGYFDGGADVIGYRTIGNARLKVVIQCKQWHWNCKKSWVKEEHICQFFGKVQEHIDPTTKLIYVTTGYATPNAKKMAEKRGVVFRDYRELVGRLCSRYSFDDFTQFVMKSKKYEPTKVFEKVYLEELSKIESVKQKEKKLVLLETRQKLESQENGQMPSWFSAEQYNEFFWNKRRIGMLVGMLVISLLIFIYFIFYQLKNQSQALSKDTVQKFAVETNSPPVYESYSTVNTKRNISKNKRPN